MRGIVVENQNPPTGRHIQTFHNKVWEIRLDLISNTESSKRPIQKPTITLRSRPRHRPDMLSIARSPCSSNALTLRKRRAPIDLQGGRARLVAVERLVSYRTRLSVKLLSDEAVHPHRQSAIPRSPLHATRTLQQHHPIIPRRQLSGAPPPLCPASRSADFIAISLKSFGVKLDCGKRGSTLPPK